MSLICQFWKQTVFPDGNDNDIENIYNSISAGGIQEIERIKGL